VEEQMTRRATVATATAIVMGAVGVVPALASGTSTPKPIKGSWSFTDLTPDPTVTVLAQTKGADPYCHGTLPAGPADVNNHTIKVSGPGALSVVGTNTLDWAMELRNARGTVLAGSDGSSPNTQEGLAVPISRAGTYTVVYCNLGGGPTASAKYTFRYRRAPN
jgi:hypothetical protein